jgi:hypothetical protein
MGEKMGRRTERRGVIIHETEVEKGCTEGDYT